MAKKNSGFSEATRGLFSSNLICWHCHFSHANCLHHIFGKVSSSPYNAAPMSNLVCHINRNGKMGGHGWHMRPAQKQSYLWRTIKYLHSIGYQPNEEDLKFIHKYGNQESLQMFEDLQQESA